MNMNEIPAEVWEMAMRVAQNVLRCVKVGGAKDGGRKQRLAESLTEAESWPLNRCVDILPFIGRVGEHSAGLFDDGRLCFAVGLFWTSIPCAHSIKDPPAYNRHLTRQTVTGQRR